MAISIGETFRGLVAGERRRGQAEDAELPDLSLPLEETRYVVFDTELTGLNSRHDSIVSIGAVAMRGTRIEVGRTFYEVVEPRTPLRGSSIVVHGITPAEVRALPTIDRILPAFLRFCAGAVIVGHVVSIDLKFLNEELLRLQGRRLPHPAVDTFQVNRWLTCQQQEACAFYDGDGAATDLAALAARYGVPRAGAHNALEDAFVTAQLFQRFLGLLPPRGIRTAGDLVRIAGP